MADDITPPSALSAIHLRLDAGDKRMQSLEEGLRENTEATRRVEANTADLVEAFEAMKSAFKVLGWIGKAARPLGWIAGAAAAIAAAWATLKGHK